MLITWGWAGLRGPECEQSWCTYVNVIHGCLTDTIDNRERRKKTEGRRQIKKRKLNQTNYKLIV